LSLRDRFNSNNSSNKAVLKEELKEEIQYYSSSEAKEEINTLGPLDTLLADDEINSIFVNGAKSIYINKNGKSFKSGAEYKDEIQYENLIKKYWIKDNKKLHFKAKHSEGVNIEVILPPLSEKTALCIKIYKDKFATLQNMQENQAISKEIALVLEALSALKFNVLITGEKNTLKTSLLSAMAKNIPSNFRGVMIDFADELRLSQSNFSNFNFSKIENNKEIEEVYNAIKLSDPEKIFINDPNDFLLSYIAKNSSDAPRGLSAVLSAKDAQGAMEKIAFSIVKYNNEISIEKAKLMAYSAFDIVICVSREGSKRKAASLGEVSTKDNVCSIKNVFVSSKDMQIQSTGLTPDFYEKIKQSSLPVSANIFDENYKHTYFQNQNANIEKKNLNLDVLKKFKKDIDQKDIKNSELNNE